MSLTICWIVAHALMGSLSCCARSAGALIPKLSAVTSPKRQFVLNFKKCVVINAPNDTDWGIPREVSRPRRNLSSEFSAQKPIDIRELLQVQPTLYDNPAPGRASADVCFI